MIFGTDGPYNVKERPTYETETPMDEIDRAIAEVLGIETPPSQRRRNDLYNPKNVFISEGPVPPGTKIYTMVYTMGAEYFVKVLQDYERQIRTQKHDMTMRVPHKTVTKEPKNTMGGVLGYTMLGQGWIVLRDDLQGDMKHMVDVHESIHTPNEYETRVITNWMLSHEPVKY